MTETHERRIRHRHELEEQHEGYAAEEAGQQEVSEDTAKHVTFTKIIEN
jgi:hypothetical protein